MFTVRKAVPEDALGITIVNVYTWKTAYSGLVPEDLIDERIEKLAEKAEKTKTDIERDGNFFVAAEGPAIVGFCCYGPCRNENCRNAGEIYAMYTLKGMEGQGVGKALFSAASQALHENGFTSVIANCLYGNPSLGFYRHLGGKVIARKKDVLHGHSISQDILCFEA